MLKKIFFGMSALALFAACNEDFTDWEQPQTNPEVAAQTIEWSVVPVQETSFVLDDLTSETVQLFTVSLPENVTVDGFNVKLTGEETNYPDYNISADKDGFVSVTDLQNATAGMYSSSVLPMVGLQPNRSWSLPLAMASILASVILPIPMVGALPSSSRTFLVIGTAKLMLVASQR